MFLNWPSLDDLRREAPTALVQMTTHRLQRNASVSGSMSSPKSPDGNPLPPPQGRKLMKWPGSKTCQKKKASGFFHQAESSKQHQQTKLTRNLLNLLRYVDNIDNTTISYVAWFTAPQLNPRRFASSQRFEVTSQTESWIGWRGERCLQWYYVICLLLVV